jgi:acetoin utilization protein AcuB
MQDGYRTIAPKDAAAHIDASLKVTRWMSKTVYSTHPGNRLIDAAEIMQDHRIRHVPVIDGDRLVGIVSDRDLRNALPRKRETRGTVDEFTQSSLARPVSEVMSRLPLTIPVDFGIHEAAEIMCREKIGALPVMDGETMVGILSAEDLLWALVEITRGTPHFDG